MLFDGEKKRVKFDNRNFLITWVPFLCSLLRMAE